MLTKAAPRADAGGGRRGIAFGHGLILVGLVVVGAAFSILLFRADRDGERRRAEAELERSVGVRVELLREKITRSTEVLQSLASLFETRGEVTRAEFDRFVERALSRQPELLALSWTPHVPADQRAAYEKRAQADGLSAFHFVEGADPAHYMTAGPRPVYLPVYFISPMTQNAVALGFDLNSDPARAAALKAAAESRSPVATAPIHLVQEHDERLGFIVFLPLFEKAGLLSGYVAAVYRFDDLLSPVFTEQADRYLSMVEDRTTTPTVLFDNQHGDTAEPSATAHFTLAGRQWAVRMTGSARMMADFRSARPYAWLVGGAVITLLLAAYLSALLRQRSVIEQQVVQRTAALSAEVRERQRAEQAARDAERKYRSIFENCTEGIFQTTPDGHYLNVNPALTRLYGYDSAEELIATMADIGAQLYVDPRRRAEFVEAVRAAGQVNGFESQVYRRDRTIIWISESARAVHDSTGKITYFEGIVEDITARKTADERLRAAYDELDQRVQHRTAELAQSNAELQAEVVMRKKAVADAERANRAKSIFLANVSHEIRTPMNAVHGYGKLLQRDPTLSPKHREAVDTILGGASHLLGLIEELLDLSKIEAGRADLRDAPFELGALVCNVVDLFRPVCDAKGVSLNLDLPPSEAIFVSGDEGKLKQVLINLVSNAWKFTDAGSVRVSVSALEGGRYQFVIRDTGMGIADEELERIFEPFTRAEPATDRQGTGLGLAIAKRYVALMDGSLRAASTPGEGSTFAFTLHLPPADEAGCVTPDAQETADFVAEDADFAVLPAEMLRALRTAAEDGNVTSLKAIVEAIESSQPGSVFAMRVRTLLKQFDTAAIAGLAETALDAGAATPASKEIAL